MNGREGETIGDCVSFPIISGGDDDEAVPAPLLFELALPLRDAVGATLTIMLANRVAVADRERVTEAAPLRDAVATTLLLALECRLRDADAVAERDLVLDNDRVAVADRERVTEAAPLRDAVATTLLLALE